MNNLARLDERRQLAAPTQTPYLPPSIASTLSDSRYLSRPWNACDALVGIVSETERRSVVRASSDFRASLQPCNREWLKKRLSGMALAFGHERDPERLAAWLSETGRLLLDLPQDILAEAIDEAIKRSERGFMPAVGQIRAIADPAVAIRRQQAERLDAMAGIITRRADGSSASTARPWEHNVAERVVEEGRIPPDRIAAFNRNMRKFGCSMRCAEDGRTYEMEPGQADPADIADASA